MSTPSHQIGVLRLCHLPHVSPDHCPRCDPPTTGFMLGTTITIQASETFWYDDQGRYHMHDPNVRRAFLSCGCGAQWAIDYLLQCPSCEFGSGAERRVEGRSLFPRERR